jgi:hypothetical protein
MKTYTRVDGTLTAPKSAPTACRRPTPGPLCPTSLLHAPRPPSGRTTIPSPASARSKLLCDLPSTQASTQYAAMATPGRPCSIALQIIPAACSAPAPLHRVPARRRRFVRCPSPCMQTPAATAPWQRPSRLVGAPQLHGAAAWSEIESWRTPLDWYASEPSHGRQGGRIISRTAKARHTRL